LPPATITGPAGSFHRRLHARELADHAPLRTRLPLEKSEGQPSTKNVTQRLRLKFENRPIAGGAVLGPPGRGSIKVSGGV
jgi:hypothetical protein